MQVPTKWVTSRPHTQKHNSQGQWLFPVCFFFLLRLSMFYSACSAPVPPPPHPSVHCGTSAGVGRVGPGSAGVLSGGRWQLDTGPSADSQRGWIEERGEEPAWGEKLLSVDQFIKTSSHSNSHFQICHNMSPDLFLIPNQQEFSKDGNLKEKNKGRVLAAFLTFSLKRLPGLSLENIWQVQTSVVVNKLYSRQVEGRRLQTSAVWKQLKLLVLSSRRRIVCWATRSRVNFDCVRFHKLP